MWRPHREGEGEGKRSCRKGVTVGAGIGGGRLTNKKNTRQNVISTVCDIDYLQFTGSSEAGDRWVFKRRLWKR